MLRPMVWATTKAIAPASILRTFSPPLRDGWPFATLCEHAMHEHQEPLRRGLAWQECNLAAVADAEVSCSFFTCKITC